MRTRLHKYNKGFSLVELLLGIGLFSMVAVIIYSVFSGGLILNRRSNEQSDVYREARWAFALIKKDLENMTAYDFSASYPEERLAFEGKSNQIKLLLPTEEGLKIIKYYMSDQENDRIHEEIVRQATKKNVTIETGQFTREKLLFLVREEIDFKEYLADDSRRGNVEVLALNMKTDGFRMRYYGQVSDVESRWVGNWGESHFPLLVEIQMDFDFEHEQDETYSLDQNVLIPNGNYKLVISKDT